MNDETAFPIAITREYLSDGNLEARIRSLLPNITMQFMTPEERRASLLDVLAEVPPGEDVWLFGYGSLMWNPAFHFVERRPGLLKGFHRRFCLWTPLGRGTPERPGLTLALEPGGSCHGIAYRIAAELRETELGIVWNREMLGRAYRPRWVRLASDAGEVRAVTFTINRGHERYAGRLSDHAVADCLSQARGMIGTCREYLEHTVANLDAMGVADGTMHRLLRQVRSLDAEAMA